jgi:hypothetical protein
MLNDFFKNPLIWVMNLFKDILIDDIEKIILFIFTILFIFLMKKFLPNFKKIIEWPFDFLQTQIDSYNTCRALKKIKKNSEKTEQIRSAIVKHIKNLYIIQKQQTAVQQLLEYPTPKGYCELIKFVVKIENKEARDELLCLMYKNAKKNWYHSIK